MALVGPTGGAVGVAWWDVIGYHAIHPYHIAFQRPSFSAYLVLIAPENTLECSSTCHLYSTMWYRSHCFIPMFLPVPHSNLHSHSQ